MMNRLRDFGDKITNKLQNLGDTLTNELNNMIFDMDGTSQSSECINDSGVANPKKRISLKKD